MPVSENLQPARHSCFLSVTRLQIFRSLRFGSDRTLRQQANAKPAVTGFLELCAREIAKLHAGHRLKVAKSRGKVLPKRHYTQEWRGGEITSPRRFFSLPHGHFLSRRFRPQWAHRTTTCSCTNTRRMLSNARASIHSNIARTIYGQSN